MRVGDHLVGSQRRSQRITPAVDQLEGRMVLSTVAMSASSHDHLAAAALIPPLRPYSFLVGTSVYRLTKADGSTVRAVLKDSVAAGGTELTAVRRELSPTRASASFVTSYDASTGQVVQDGVNGSTTFHGVLHRTGPKTFVTDGVVTGPAGVPEVQTKLTIVRVSPRISVYLQQRLVGESYQTTEAGTLRRLG